ncbi:hypothetical protein [Christensenella hongkongensis]|uniref:hypothetical protein n=1 Tax=Christensenella hongkongensis TaxID=270498 RepID=UPI002673E9EA|nr:hypothetical protein [Christensenella hongkongensis]
MKKCVAIILIICVVFSLGGTGLAVDIGPGVVPTDMGGDYPQYGEEHDLDSTVTIELTNKGNGILFTVVDKETGEPIEGATFSERLVAENKPDLTKAATNENGQYFCEQPVYTQGRDYLFIVSAVGYKSSGEIPVTYTKGLVEVRVELERIKLPTLFVVKNEIGQPVAGALVEIQDTVLRAAHMHTCDSMGHANCELADGMYAVHVTHPYHEDYTCTLKIDHNAEASHTEEIVMQRRKFDTDVYVLDENGVPIQDAVVNMGGQAVRTDSYGHGKILDLYAGGYPVTVTAPGYVQYSETASIPADNNVLTIRLRKVLPEPTPTPTDSPKPEPTDEPAPTDTPEPGQTDQPGPVPSRNPGGSHIGGENGGGSGAARPAPTASVNASTSPMSTANVDKYAGLPVDIAFWVRYDDGEPAANLDLELHSTVRDGRTDEQGWEEIHDVEMGMHTVYVKQQGKVLASRNFDLYRDSMTNLLLDEGTGITVRDGVFSIIIEVEIPRNGGDAQVVAVREGYREKTDEGSSIVIAGQGDEMIKAEGTVECKPICLMTTLFGHPMGICLFLGLPCWAWLFIIAAAVIIAVVLIVRKKKKKQEEKRYTIE